MLQPPMQRAPSTEEAQNRRLDTFRHYGRQVGLPLVVAALIGLFTATSDVFFSAQNFRNIGVAAAALAAVSFGQTFTILTAGLDLSVGSTVALVSIVGAFAMRNYGVGLGVLAALACGAAAGLVNGLVITKLKVFPFIATLATLSIFSGLALSLSAGVPVTGVPVDFSDLAYELMFGIPVPVVIAAAVLVVSHVILTYTRLGRRIYAVGGNEEAARLSGINIDGVKLAAYALSGFCAAVGSVILTARVASGQPGNRRASRMRRQRCRSRTTSCNASPPSTCSTAPTIPMVWALRAPRRARRSAARSKSSSRCSVRRRRR
jgi:ribose transport system permease protein